MTTQTYVDATSATPDPLTGSLPTPADGVLVPAPVVALPGDGIGPEIMAATRKILDAAGAKIRWIEAEAGASVMEKGIATGLPKETMDAVADAGTVLKGPLATPVGFGGKSANVTLRKHFETFGNIRPARDLPGISPVRPGGKIDMVIVRENVEDLYAGIEHMQTPSVAQCLKLISRTGSAKAARLAFQYAQSAGRKTVAAATKANIMKLSEGMMKRVFEEVAGDYPDIEARHLIVDDCAHRMAKNPQDLDVIVTTNMNGDILSDLAAGLTGGLGLAPSANIGHDVTIFEAVHGSAPDIAGKGVANPTALLLAAVMMLRSLGQATAANRVEGAVLAVLEKRATLTPDLAPQGRGVSTGAFTDAVIGALGHGPQDWVPPVTKPLVVPPLGGDVPKLEVKEDRCIGVDVFLHSAEEAEGIGQSLDAIATHTGFKLSLISNRGIQLYPATGAIAEAVDHWRCRFKMTAEVGAVGDAQILDLLMRIGQQHKWVHVEKLRTFDGVDGFAKAQGEK